MNQMTEQEKENLDLVIHAAWGREKADDHLRDTHELLVSWDYFKAGYLTALATHQGTPGNPQRTF